MVEYKLDFFLFERNYKLQLPKKNSGGSKDYLKMINYCNYHLSKN